MSIRQRLEKADKIALGIYDTLYHAVALYELFARGAYRKDVSRALDQTFEAHGSNLILDALHGYLVIALMRVYDDDNKAASFPNIIRILFDKNVQKAIADRHYRKTIERPIGSVGHLDEVGLQIREQMRKERAERITKQCLGHLLAGLRSFERIRKNNMREALKDRRDRYLAHNDLRPSRRTVKYGYELSILNQSLRVFDKISLGLTATNYNFSDARDTWRERASYFWRHVARMPASKKAFNVRRKRRLAK